MAKKNIKNMTEKKDYKVALFGGTFDPVHVGHIEICERLNKKYAFDKFIIMPCGDPPHKESNSSAQQRYEMCKLAFAGKNYEVSRFEIENGGKSFTYLTLEHLIKDRKSVV